MLADKKFFQPSLKIMILIDFDFLSLPEYFLKQSMYSYEVLNNLFDNDIPIIIFKN